MRAARSAQSGFESFRRAHLPVRGEGSPDCDVRIGRYCYWRGEEGDDATPPPESKAVVERRDELLRLLDSASRALPGDEWVGGQRVRYLAEAQRTDEALRYTRSECRARASWCLSLAGYAAHVAGRFALADSAYTAALAAMSDDERCRWLDISAILSDDAEGEFNSLDCAARERYARRALWLGAPLFSVAASDLFTEHMSRLTRARIAEHSASTDGVSWGEDARELTIRYGWSRWYSRVQPGVGSMDAPSITGHDTGVPYDFIPGAHAIEHLGHVTAADWSLGDPRARTGYAPSYARSVHDLPNQVALFRRGDSTLAVAGWDARRDTTLLGRPLDAALVLAGGETSAVVARLHDASALGHLQATARLDSGLVSLEVLAAGDRRAARARFGISIGTGGRVALSDLLLHAALNPAPESLAAVSDSALPSNVLTGLHSVGVFWEVYGLRAEGEPVRYSLLVAQVGDDWLHRAAAALHLADPTTSLRVQWEEVPHQASGIAARGVRVDVSQLRAGRYRMELTVTPADGPPVVSWRDLVIR